MNKELKPCPFCGGKAQLDHDGLADYSYVRCMECHARTREITVASYHCSDDKAIELWNHRADVLENVKGEWEHWGSPFSDESEVIDTIVCSVCGARFIEPKDETKGEYNFCPNCGAQMEK